MSEETPFGAFFVRRTHQGRVLWLRFDHGKANEMGKGQVADVERLCTLIEDSPEIVALVTYSERTSRRGTPIFVSGANVTERVPWTSDQVKTHVLWQRAVLERVAALPVFHVAVVSGVAFGWGTEYALSADYRLATPTALFALPETGLGIVPGAGGTATLAKHVGQAHALRMGMTGEAAKGKQAVEIGLAQELLPTLPEALERAKGLVEGVIKRSPTANAAFKRVVTTEAGAKGERVAYEHCVDAGEAAIGRENFAAARKGEPIVWGSRQPVPDFSR